MTSEDREVLQAKQNLVAARLSLGMAQDDLANALIRQVTVDTGPRSLYTKEHLAWSVDHWRGSVHDWLGIVAKAEVRYTNALMVRAKATSGK